MNNQSKQKDKVQVKPEVFAKSLPSQGNPKSIRDQSRSVPPFLDPSRCSKLNPEGLTKSSKSIQSPQLRRVLFIGILFFYSSRIQYSSLPVFRPHWRLECRVFDDPSKKR
ncbi:hypothetical protein PGT21_016685 [Puccinia graminis f. sp. tritici]|uniref:Uncharacterized protein n=1 Tax=Puccinia graminis f. sp. tritici TaxID=56615 RepID=A0A5B0QZ66_PUCGR|nr:hypothetical protein PGT21_036937 [Puccinia graminis f. sp. tritici]KAA1118054.1 hypothetical protein PGT21_030515 [Puccinia graminis f. sp. tritici]KAA1119164.1 hypothetical protein PGT21_016685 [Puccinia graminis f. sp. tritici]